VLLAWFQCLAGRGVEMVCPDAPAVKVVRVRRSDYLVTCDRLAGQNKLGVKISRVALQNFLGEPDLSVCII